MSILIRNQKIPRDCQGCFMKHLIRGEKIIDGTIHDMWYGDCKGEFIETLYNANSLKIVRVGRREDCPLSLPLLVPEQEKILHVLKTERECVSRDCNRDCANCELSLEREEILSVYDALIAMLDSEDKEREG